MVSGFHFFGDSFSILSASEDSHSLMGGSVVVHCVQVPLTGTTLEAIKEQDESVENSEHKVRVQQARYHKPCGIFFLALVRD